MLCPFSKKQFGKRKYMVIARTNTSVKAALIFGILVSIVFLYLDFNSREGPNHSYIGMYAGLFVFFTASMWMTSSFIHHFEKAIVFPDFDADFFSVGQMYVIEFSSVTGLVLGKNSLLLKRDTDEYILSTNHLSPVKFRRLKKFLKQKLEGRVLELPVTARCSECSKKMKHTEPGPFSCPHCDHEGEFTGEEFYQEAKMEEEAA
jgi:hypothetical protein